MAEAEDSWFIDSNYNPDEPTVSGVNSSENVSAEKGGASSLFLAPLLISTMLPGVYELVTPDFPSIL